MLPPPLVSGPTLSQNTRVFPGQFSTSSAPVAAGSAIGIAATLCHAGIQPLRLAEWLHWVSIVIMVKEKPLFTYDFLA